MRNLLYRAQRFLRSEDGPTTTEYAVMLAAIVMVCIAAIGGIGNTVSNIFTNTEAGLPTAS
jgi:pilus assembly protein Flp/PilA